MPKYGQAAGCLCTDTLTYFHSQFCAIAVQYSEMQAQIATWACHFLDESVCARVCFQSFHWHFKLIIILCVNAADHRASATCSRRDIRHKWNAPCSDHHALPPRAENTDEPLVSTHSKCYWNKKHNFTGEGQHQVKAAMECNNKVLKTKAFICRSTLFSLTKLMWLQVLHTLS